MDVIICTHGRVNNQITYANMPKSIQKKIVFVVQWSEYYHMKERWPDNEVVALPPHIKNLPDTRQWLHWNYCRDKMVMMDDDLVFGKRRGDEPTKFKPCTDQDLEIMFQVMKEELSHYVHVGVSHREGANRNTDVTIECNRMMRVLAYRSDAIRELKIASNRIPDMEDFDVTLQLLRLGMPNLILNRWVHNQSGSNTEGGCSGYRTLETHARDCYIMADELHPGFVKAVLKETKGAWGGGTRTDVRIQWKKAYAEGVASLLDNRAREHKIKEILRQRPPVDWRSHIPEYVLLQCAAGGRQGNTVDS